MKLPDITPEQIDALRADQQQLWRDLIDRQAEHQRHVNDLAASRDFTRALALVGSEERATHIAAWDDQFTFTDDEAERIVREWWTSTEAWSGDPFLRGTMMGLLERVAPIHVLDDTHPRPLPDGDTLTVYRGNLGEKPDAGSWTLDLAIAERFALASVSVRAQIVFGIDPTGKTPTVWRGTVPRDRILGYFDDRAEQEVVLPAGAVFDPLILGQMVASRDESSYSVGKPAATAAPDATVIQKPEGGPA